MRLPYDDAAESRRLLLNWMLVVNVTFAVAWLVMALFSDRVLMRVAAALFSAIAIATIVVWRRNRRHS